MSATTVKIDGEVLAELKRIKPAGGTLTALVRDLLESEIRRRKMARAAAKYVAFLGKHPGESEELDAWASAPLERDAPARNLSRTRKR
jgi:hypothetical protein